MVRKDYYLILGVSPRADFRGIQEAFRDLAKIYHPDRAGPQATRQFQEIQEAYEVLSDPEKRRLYNHEREREERRSQRRTEPLSPRFRSQPEPLIAEPLSIFRDFGTIRPSFEPLFDRFLRNFTAFQIPKGERVEGLNVEVVLSSEEAFTGLTLPIGVPVFHACRYCGGTGREWLFPCLECHAQGLIETEETVNIRIPPLVRDRAIIEVPLRRLGINNFHLRLHIRVSD
ncbi:MAG TPA: DnaJ domain-containing protein [Candidatus Eisenbacteria bacterium]|nr:DnaJ domain-containing protein [Candidatus Eisenbacteria bacterium]